MKSKFIIIGIVLLLCLPAFAIMGGVGAYFAPREYFSKCTLEFGGSDRAEFEKAFQLAAQSYGKSASLREVRNTGLYEIGIYDADPQQAANKANGMAIVLQEKLRNSAMPPTESTARPSGDSREAAELSGIQARIATELHRPPVRIWEKAERAAVPSRPNVPFIMGVAIAMGMVFAACGVVLLIIGLIARDNHPPRLPKIV